METGYTIITAEERERLILEHLPQVRWVAASIHERLPASVSEDDLVSTGILGLIAAIDNFDPGRSTSLRTYAEYRIRGAILDSIRGLDTLSTHKRKRARQMQEAMAAAEQKLQRTPLEEEVATELGLSIREYRAWLDELKGITVGSLDSAAGEDGGAALIHYIADESQEPVPVTIEREQMRKILAAGIAAMPELEQTILDLYFHRELTLAEIGRVMGLHVSRISQLKNQAVLRLKTWMERRMKPAR